MVGGGWLLAVGLNLVMNGSIRLFVGSLLLSVFAPVVVGCIVVGLCCLVSVLGDGFWYGLSSLRVNWVLILIFLSIGLSVVKGNGTNGGDDELFLSKFIFLSSGFSLAIGKGNGTNGGDDELFLPKSVFLSTGLSLAISSTRLGCTFFLTMSGLAGPLVILTSNFLGV